MISGLPAQNLDEIFDLVDERDRVIGQATRGEVHATGARHRAVHVLLHDAGGNLFLQRRSKAKDTFPGAWDSSSSGHLDSGEDYHRAARRELREELGLVQPGLSLRPLIKLPASPETGNEFIQVFVAGPVAGPFSLNPAEIAEGQFVAPTDIDQFVATRPDGFAGAFRLLWQQHRAAILQEIALGGGAPAREVPIEVLGPAGSRRRNQTSLIKKFGYGMAGLGLFFFKFGVLFLKLAKPLLSGGLMLITYTYFYGWKFAVGVVFLLFVHEMGHVIAARLIGMRTSGFIFIPFFGAMTTLQEYPQSAWRASLFALGGPVIGSVGAAFALAIGLFFQIDWIIAVGVFGFGLNLLNLIPTPPFDGGTICAAVSPWFWFVGLALLGTAILYFNSISWFIILIIFALFGLPQFISAFSGKDPEARAYYATHWPRRLLMAGIYLALVVSLLGALYLSVPLLPPTDALSV